MIHKRAKERASERERERDREGGEKEKVLVKKSVSEREKPGR